MIVVITKGQEISPLLTKTCLHNLMEKIRTPTEEKKNKPKLKTEVCEQ